jgi:RimJ/RimL family protein N-acetyltransferase
MSRGLEGALTFRSVTMDDAELLLQWRNDPETRRASRQTAPVTRHEHLEWLAKSLGSPPRTLRIVEKGGVPVGVVRADLVNGAHELSWTVAPAARGSGVGKWMVARFASEFPGPLRAEVRKDNPASMRIAEFVGMVIEKEEGDFLCYSRG